MAPSSWIFGRPRRLLSDVTRADYRADIDEIKTILGRIWDKLDDKADK